MANKGIHKGRDIAPKVREAFDLALKNMRDSSGGVVTLSAIIQDCLINDPLKTLDTMSKFIPKELLIDETVEIRVINGDPMDAEEWKRQFVEQRPAIETAPH